jgi:hypothetical protein
MATAGTPLRISWNRKQGVFRYRFRADPGIAAPTEIFAPPECLGAKPMISVQALTGDKDAPGLKAEYSAEDRRVLVRNEGCAGEAEITLARSS